MDKDHKVEVDQKYDAGKKIASIRKKVLHMTQEVLGNNVGVSRGTVAAIEEGRIRVTTEFLVPFCKLAKIDYADVLPPLVKTLTAVENLRMIKKLLNKIRTQSNTEQLDLIRRAAENLYIIKQNQDDVILDISSKYTKISSKHAKTLKTLKQEREKL